ncbi:unnamed protein product [Pleuronectes platessa]|uniref:Uncharacterized protein n=1 Tax=Pleuronectes platessa TaxID=8262 RepID=A0A9N7YX15_PLEPL|nr:unnamed protein product [Pleuronectes platessa]
MLSDCSPVSTDTGDPLALLGTKYPEPGAESQMDDACHVPNCRGLILEHAGVSEVEGRKLMIENKLSAGVKEVGTRQHRACLTAGKKSTHESSISPQGLFMSGQSTRKQFCRNARLLDSKPHSP